LKGIIKGRTFGDDVCHADREGGQGFIWSSHSSCSVVRPGGRGTSTSAEDLVFCFLFRFLVFPLGVGPEPASDSAIVDSVVSELSSDSEQGIDDSPVWPPPNFAIEAAPICTCSSHSGQMFNRC
jgi:hypothetical protein